MTFSRRPPRRSPSSQQDGVAGAFRPGDDDRQHGDDRRPTARDGRRERPEARESADGRHAGDSRSGDFRQDRRDGRQGRREEHHARQERRDRPDFRRHDRRDDGGRMPGRNESGGGRAESGASGETRLNKALADAGVCSRRKADEMIFAGRVRVNGVVETSPGRRILASDILSVDGAALERASARLFHYLLHKPPQVVCTADDPEGRETVLDFLPEEARSARLYPVGRLDYFSEGALLLTNDGAWAQNVMHPRRHVPKRYEVLIRGDVPEDFLSAVRRGMRLKDGTDLLPAEAEARRTARGDTVLVLTLRQGINRQIRRMAADADLTILKLRRVAIGPLELGDLARGEIRPLTRQEIALFVNDGHDGDDGCSGGGTHADPRRDSAGRPRQICQAGHQDKTMHPGKKFKENSSER